MRTAVAASRAHSAFIGVSAIGIADVAYSIAIVRFVSAHESTLSAGAFIPIFTMEAFHAAQGTNAASEGIVVRTAVAASRTHSTFIGVSAIGIAGLAHTLPIVRFVGAGHAAYITDGVVAEGAEMFAISTAYVAVAVFKAVVTEATAKDAQTLPIVRFVDTGHAADIAYAIHPGFFMRTAIAASLTPSVLEGVSAIGIAGLAQTLPIVGFVSTHEAAQPTDSLIPASVVVTDQLADVAYALCVPVMLTRLLTDRARAALIIVFTDFATGGAYRILVMRCVVTGCATFVADAILSPQALVVTGLMANATGGGGFIIVLADRSAPYANTGLPESFVVAGNTALITYVVIPKEIDVLAVFAASVTIAFLVGVSDHRAAKVTHTLPIVRFVDTGDTALIAYVVVAKESVVIAVSAANGTPAFLVGMSDRRAANFTHSLPIMALVLAGHVTNGARAVYVFMRTVDVAMDAHTCIPFMSASGGSAIAADLTVGITLVRTGLSAPDTPVFFVIVVTRHAACDARAASILVATFRAAFVAYAIVAPELVVVTALTADLTLTELAIVGVVVVACLTAGGTFAFLKFVGAGYVTVTAHAFIPIMEASLGSALVTELTFGATLVATEGVTNVASAIFVFMGAFLTAFLTEAVLVVLVLTGRATLLADTVGPGVVFACHTAFITDAVGIGLVVAGLLTGVTGSVLIIVDTGGSASSACSLIPRVEAGYRAASVTYLTLDRSVVRAGHTADAAPVVFKFVPTASAAYVTVAAVIFVLTYGATFVANAFSVKGMHAYSSAYGADSLGVVVTAHVLADGTEAFGIVLVLAFHLTLIANAFSVKGVLADSAAFLTDALSVVVLTDDPADLTRAFLVVVMVTYRTTFFADTFVPVSGMVTYHAALVAHAVGKGFVLTVDSTDPAAAKIVVLVGTRHTAFVADAFLPPTVRAGEMTLIAHAVGEGFVLTAHLTDRAPTRAVVLVVAGNVTVNASAIEIFVSVAFLVVGIFPITANRTDHTVESVLLTGLVLMELFIELAEEGFVNVVFSLVVRVGRHANTALIRLASVGVGPLEPTEQLISVEGVVFVALEDLPTDAVHQLPCGQGDAKLLTGMILLYTVVSKNVSVLVRNDDGLVSASLSTAEFGGGYVAAGIGGGGGMQIVDGCISLVEVGDLTALVAHVLGIVGVEAGNIGGGGVVAVGFVGCMIMACLIVNTADNRLRAVGYVIRVDAIQVEVLGIGVSAVFFVSDLLGFLGIDVAAITAGVDRGRADGGTGKVAVTRIQPVLDLSTGTFIDEYTNAIIGRIATLAVVFVVLLGEEEMRRGGADRRVIGLDHSLAIRAVLGNVDAVDILMILIEAVFVTALGGIVHGGGGLDVHVP